MNDAAKMLLAKKKYKNCSFPLDEACHDIVSLRVYVDMLKGIDEKLKENIIGLVDHLDACGAYADQKQADDAKARLTLK